MASAEFIKAREADGSICVWTVDVYFPVFEAKAEKFYRFATEAIELDGITYEANLNDIPKMRHQRDRGNDYAEFSAVNPSNALYNSFVDYEDLIESAMVTIKECYEIDKGYFESEISFFGYLKDFTVDEANKVLAFTVLADTSRANFPVGGRVLTRERCGTDFNYQGRKTPDTPDFDPCGWQLAQGGNPIYCSHYMKGVDGCEAHNNEHRFFAVPALSAATVVAIQSGGLLGGGQGGGDNGFDPPPPCFTSKTLIWLGEGLFKPIYEIRKGDFVMAFNRATGFIQSSKVLEVFIHDVNTFERVTFQKGSVIESTREHPFYVGNGTFISVAFLEGKAVKHTTEDEKWLDDTCISTESVSHNCFVYNFHTELETYFVSDSMKKEIYAVHNTKRVDVFGQVQDIY